MKLAFVPFARRSPGLIAQLLQSSYAHLIEELPNQKAEELVRAWHEYDADVYAEPDTVGACGFFSLLNGEVVGLGSWNPIDWPRVAVIGHNCVLPQHQGRGYGRRQIEELLRRFHDAGFQKAVVCTDEHPFFEPAQRMYLSCDFKESRRHAGELLPQYAMIEYERRVRGQDV